MRNLLFSEANRSLRRLGLLLAGLLLLNLALLGFISFGSGSVQTAHAATTYKVLFDNTRAETAGNADWIISTSQPDPLTQNANPQVETDWTGAISAWGVGLQKTGRYSLKTLTSTYGITYGNSSNPYDLKNFNEFVVPEPNVLFSTSEKTAIMKFVQNGGGLFMVADHQGSDRNNDGYDSLQIWNDLMTNNSVNSSDPFGFSFDSVNIANDNPSGIPASAANNPVISGPFGKVTGSIIRNGTTETLHPSDNSNVTGLIYTTGSSTTGTTGVFFLTSTFGQGRVAAWGDSSAIDDGTGSPGNTVYDGWDDPSGTDAQLALNATEWLAQGGSTVSPTPTPTTNPTSTPTVHPTSTPTTGPTSTPTVRPTSTPTSGPTPTPTSGGSKQLISNGGFESGSTNWTESSSGGYEIVDSSSSDIHHSGSASAWLCGYNSCADSIYQTITVPSNVTSATLTFWTYVSTQETSSSAYDYFYAKIRNSSGSVLSTVKTLTNGTASGWQQTTVSLTSYKGQTVQVYFNATNDSEYPTDFFLDDISVVAQ